MNLHPHEINVCGHVVGAVEALLNLTRTGKSILASISLAGAVRTYAPTHRHSTRTCVRLRPVQSGEGARPAAHGHRFVYQVKPSVSQLSHDDGPTPPIHSGPMCKAYLRFKPLHLQQKIVGSLPRLHLCRRRDGENNDKMKENMNFFHHVRERTHRYAQRAYTRVDDDVVARQGLRGLALLPRGPGVALRANNR
ncbi:hypothetical protein EVAR_78978_1 [Eumeta japonica]|uniref:Uncharacterized protein n=1 Tax=Eumeta variegata TaxID=151549 RepID=A0A4C1UTY9_EUMVA|nr:hypothetical protein EVAR_78978_1 [Eumeta japonica]